MNKFAEILRESNLDIEGKYKKYYLRFVKYTKHLIIGLCIDNM